MVWTHPALLIGLALTGIPVLLHLLLRAKPKKLVFPALRLIQNRRRTNVRRMRLRHLWLLLLRMAVVAGLVVAVARPSVPAANYVPQAGDWLRLFAVAAIATGAYIGLIRLWKSRKVPQHLLSYRRSLLRAGVGIATLLALTLFVAWPYQHRIAAAITQPTINTDEFVPVAAVMLFDTSLSMTYRHESRTRLEVAQEIASRHAGSLPRTSRIAVCDTGSDAPIRLQGDLSGGVRRIGALTVQPGGRPLDDRLLAAVEAQIEDHERTRAGEGAALAAAGQDSLLREIYVFTDLARSAWRRDESPRLKEALERIPSLSIYLIDVGVADPSNVGISDLTLSDQTVPIGNELGLRALVSAVGVEPAERTIELYLENELGHLVKQGQQIIKVDSRTAVAANFSVRAQAGPVLQGELRIASSDPLGFDDTRSFSVRVPPPPEILVVSESRPDARYLMDALAPAELLTQGQARYRCKLIAAGGIVSEKLSRFSVVCLANVPELTPGAWNALADYVAQGGGLAIVLGDRVKHAAYLVPAARNLLPGELVKTVKFDPPVFLDLDQVTHPLLRKFADWGVVGLNSVEIHQFWRVQPARRDSAVIATYTDPRRGPALVERALGKGRILMLTTGLDRRWNDLPGADWWFLALADQLMQYLSRSTESHFNYTIGQDVLIPLEPGKSATAYLLRKPLLQQLRGEIAQSATVLAVRDADQLGNYRLKGLEPDTHIDFGFSVNADAAESDLGRLTKDELDSRLGTGRHTVARSIENLEHAVQAGRRGLEAFPLVVMLLLAVFVGEHFVANRFYDSEQRPEPVHA